MATITLRAPDGQTIKFSYEGATLGEATPAGAALELITAQFEQDRAKCLRLLVASSRVMVPADTTPPAPFFGDVEFRVNDVKIDGSGATIGMSMRSAMTGDQPLPYSMVCAQETGVWRVDLMATMELAMSAMQGAVGAAQQGIEQLGDAVGNLQDLLKKLDAELPEKDRGAEGSL